MNRKFIMGAIGISVVILLAWWFLMWSPAGKDIAAAESRYDLAQTQASSLTAQVARLRATEENMPQLQSRLQTLSA
ncbi:MAG: type II secretion system protein M, partial [Acidimicrobiales bacterium]|nr:type II secretion system protein M [Acidimicrobiales bacterium]